MLGSMIVDLLDRSGLRAVTAGNASGDPLTLWSYRS